MTQIHFNQATHLRIKDVKQFVPGKKYLMVHNRGNTQDDIENYYPPNYQEVWATGVEFTSFDELSKRAGHTRVKNQHALQNRWFFFYAWESSVLPSSYVPLSENCAADHGFTDSERYAHVGNFVLDLEDLEKRGIEILREVSPGTDMRYEPIPDPYEDFDSFLD